MGDYRRLLHRHRLQNVVFSRLQVNHDSRYTSIPCVSLPLLLVFSATTVGKRRDLKATSMNCFRVTRIFFCLHDSFTGIMGMKCVTKATLIFLYEQRASWQSIAPDQMDRDVGLAPSGEFSPTGGSHHRDDSIRRRRSRASCLDEKPILQREQMVAFWRGAGSHNM